MTLKEKIAEIKPDEICGDSAGGVFGCPGDYIELRDRMTCNQTCKNNGEDEEMCEKCWNREYNADEPPDLLDPVNHPVHYETGAFECIDVMVETQGAEAVKNFCICNAFKYLYRHKRKNGLEDIKKAQWYINKYIELEGKKDG